MDRDAGECVEARGGAEEGVVPFGHEDAAWVGVEAGEDGVEVG